MITILTTPRRQKYTADTLRDLVDNGIPTWQLDYCRLLVDGDSMKVCNVPPNWQHVEIHDGVRRKGTAGAVNSALKYAHAVLKHYPRSWLYFEDDTKGCKQSVIAMDYIKIPDDCAFLVFCDIIERGTKEPSFRRYKGERETLTYGHWGNQALKIRPDAVDYVISNGIELPKMRYPHSSDVLLAHALCAPPSPWPYYGVVSPSLFNHVGVQSSINPRAPFKGKGRVTANYAGDDFDALSVDWASVVK